MRLKTFHADSMADAMTLVRDQLGEDAIIVATQEDGGGQGVRVTAAMEQDDPLFEDIPTSGPDEDILEHLTDVLERHGTPIELTDRIIDSISGSDKNTPLEYLTEGLSEVFKFAPIKNNPGQPPILLIGPPGVGKTVSCAKLATSCALNDDEANIIGMDHMRIAAHDQLSGYAQHIGAKLFKAEEGKSLTAILTKMDRDDIIFIDTPGTNPYSLEDVAYLVELAETMTVEPVLVLNAGRDGEEASDLSTAFRPVGPKRLIITGYDIARRLGSMLAAADAANMALANLSPGPQLTDKLEELSAEKLARRMLSISIHKKNAGQPLKQTTGNADR